MERVKHTELPDITVSPHYDAGLNLIRAIVESPEATGNNVTMSISLNSFGEVSPDLTDIHILRTIHY